VIYLEVLWRTLAAYAGILLMTRLSGKQQVRQLNFFEYVVGITIGSTASTLSVNTTEPFLPTLLGLVLWVGLGIFLHNLGLRSRRWGKILRGEPTLVIQNGRILEKALRRMPNFTVDDLLMLLRNKDVFDVGQVEYAMLELDGTLSVLKKSEYQSPTAKDLKLKKKPVTLPTELVYDGRIIAKNLAGLGKDEDWLRRQLRAHKVERLEDVVLAQLGPDGTMYVDVRDDQPIRFDVSDYEGQAEKL